MSALIVAYDVPIGQHRRIWRALDSLGGVRIQRSLFRLPNHWPRKLVEIWLRAAIDDHAVIHVFEATED